MELIDKAKVVEEIKKRIKEIDKIGTYLSPKGVLTNLLCFLDSLEVKEVDKEILENIFPEHKESEGIKTLAHMWADTYRDETSYKIAYNSFLEGAKWHSWAKY